MIHVRDTKLNLQVINADERKYISKIYKVMLNDIAGRQNNQNWASLVRNTLANLGFFEVWLAQVSVT